MGLLHAECSSRRKTRSALTIRQGFVEKGGSEGVSVDGRVLDP